MRISSYLEDIFRSAVSIFRTLYHTCAVMETWEVRVTWAALTWSGGYAEVHRSSAAALFWTDIKVHVCSHVHLQLVSCKCINNLVFGFVTWIISAIKFYTHTHIVSSTLFLVPLALDSCWSVRGGQSRAFPWASGFVCLLLLGSPGGIRVLERRKLRFSGSCITAAVGFVCLVQLLPL